MNDPSDLQGHDPLTLDPVTPTVTPGYWTRVTPILIAVTVTLLILTAYSIVYRARDPRDPIDDRIYDQVTTVTPTMTPHVTRDPHTVTPVTPLEVTQ